MRLAAQLIKGRITADMIIRQTKTGKSVVNFDVAINETVNNQTTTTYVKFVAWEKDATKAARYGKGDMVWVESVIGDTKSYTNREGNLVTYVELVVTDIIGQKKGFTSSPVTNTPAAAPAPAAAAAPASTTEKMVTEEWD